jgi:hypothetical protein
MGDLGMIAMAQFGKILSKQVATIRWRSDQGRFTP